MTVPSCPDDRTITSSISMGVKSDRTVTSTYVFGAKMGLVTVFCLPFQKRSMKTPDFLHAIIKGKSLCSERKNGVPTRL